MTRRFALFLLAPLLAVPASAGTRLLVSPPIVNEAGGVVCSIANGGPKNITLTNLWISGSLGTVPMLGEHVVLGPGQLYARSNFETVGHCMFAVEGSLKGVRAAACRWEGEEGEMGTGYDCVEAR